MIKLSAIIINYNTPEMTKYVIRRLRESEPDLACEIILIENNSDERLRADEIEELGVKYIENRENFGFAKAVNQGIAASSGEFILLLNSDVLVEAGAVSKLVAYLESHPDTAAVGPHMRYPDGREQASFGYYPNALRELVRLSTLYKIIPYATLAKKNFFNKRLWVDGGEVDWLSGGCLLIRRSVFDRIGTFDEKFFFGVEDIDFCYRARQAGLGLRYLPAAKVIHYHGFSSGGPRTIAKMEMERRNLNYFFTKHLPESMLARWLINIMHWGKISIFKVLEKTVK